MFIEDRCFFGMKSEKQSILNPKISKNHAEGSEQKDYCAEVMFPNIGSMVMIPCLQD